MFGMTGSDRVGFGGLKRLRRVSVPLIGLAMLAGSCTTPPSSSPSLPPDIGVTWFADTGGTYTANPFPSYEPAISRYSTLGGATTGPTALTPAEFQSEWALPPQAGAAPIKLLPDGTARFPWNGFAGEDFSVTVTPAGEVTNYTVTFPGGSCTWPLNLAQFDSIIPSPDGSMMAMFRTDFDASTRQVSIVEATTGCPEVVTVANALFNNSAAVWAPDSSAILYGAYQSGDDPSYRGRVARLDTAPASSPVIVMHDPGAFVTPLGWSESNSFLYVSATTSLGGSTTSKIQTMNLVSGTHSLIDTAVFPSEIAGTSIRPGGHYGYFVPGTTLVVFNEGTTAVANGTGQQFPFLRVRLRDTTTGQESAVGGTSPVTWHDEGGIDVPNIEMLDRFIR